jgi:hypothetical protein
VRTLAVKDSRYSAYGTSRLPGDISKRRLGRFVFFGLGGHWVGEVYDPTPFNKFQSILKLIEKA